MCSSILSRHFKICDNSNDKWKYIHMHHFIAYIANATTTTSTIYSFVWAWIYSVFFFSVVKKLLIFAAVAHIIIYQYESFGTAWAKKKVNSLFINDGGVVILANQFIGRAGERVYCSLPPITVHTAPMAVKSININYYHYMLALVIMWFQITYHGYRGLNGWFVSTTTTAAAAAKQMSVCFKIINIYLNQNRLWLIDMLWRRRRLWRGSNDGSKKKKKKKMKEKWIPLLKKGSTSKFDPDFLFRGH